MIYMFIALKRRVRRFIGVLRAVGLAGLAVTVVVTGTILFYFAEPVLPSGAKNTLFSSLYWVVTTLTTVGYGDIYPSNFWARIVFFYVVIFGLGVFAAVLTELGTYLSNKSFLQMHGLHRIKLKRHVIIVGYGESTNELISRLERHDMDIVLVDQNIDPALMASRGINTVSGNPLHSDTLRKAGISSADSLVISSQPDELSVMVSLKAKELNPEIVVISACQKFEDFQIMSSAKIDLLIPVSKLQGDLLADAVVDSKGLGFLIHMLGGANGLRLDELMADRTTTVGELMRSRNERPIALHSGKDFIVDFNSETQMAAGDYIITISPRREDGHHRS